MKRYNIVMVYDQEFKKLLFCKRSIKTIYCERDEK